MRRPFRNAALAALLWTVFGGIWGLSSLLWSGMQFTNGRAVQSNFNQYRVVRMPEAPLGREYGNCRSRREQ
jgi:hypothetical protein